MNNYQITIVEPTAIGLLEDMAKKNLIKLLPFEPKQRFRTLLSTLREAENPPTLEEITREVESVREERYSGKHED